MIVKSSSPVAPLTVLASATSVDVGMGWRDTRKAYRNFFGQSVNSVELVSVGRSELTKKIAYTGYNAAGCKRYFLKVVTTIGLADDKIGFVMVGEGDTPALALHNLLRLEAEMSQYTTTDIVRLSVDFTNDFLFDLEDEFTTSANAPTLGLPHMICWKLNTPSVIEDGCL